MTFHKINMLFSNSIQNIPAQNIPAQNTPVQNISIQNTHAQNTPTKNTPLAMGNMFSVIKNLVGKSCGSCGGR